MINISKKLIFLLLAVLILPGCFEVEIGLDKKTRGVLESAIDELGQQPYRWESVLNHTINELGDVGSSMAKKILNDVKNVYDSALGDTQAAVMCQTDFFGVRVQQQLRKVLAKFTEKPFSEVVIPVICNSAPNTITAGETKKIEINGFDFLSFKNEGAFLVSVAYGSGNNIIRGGAGFVSVTSNYQLTIDIQGQDFSSLDFTKGPMLVLKWQNGRYEGSSEITIQKPAPKPTPKPHIPPVTYDIEVKTSDIYRAGTSAKVEITLYGENGTTPKRQLDTENYNDFERDNKDIFTQTYPKDPGDLKKIFIQHDNTNGKAGWHLDYIKITNLRTKKVWRFECNRWLSKSDDDGKIGRFLTPNP